MEQAGGGAKTQPITPAGLERPKPCLGDQDQSTAGMPRALQALQEASWLPPFLGGDSAGWRSRRRPGFEGEAHVSPRKTCPIVMANAVSLIIPEWREQEVNNETAKHFPTAHTVPLQNTKHCSTINGAVWASPHSFSQIFSSGHPKINTAPSLPMS